MTIGQLCTSTLNVKTFLEKGLVDQLINLVLLGGDDNVKKEAVVCLSKVSMFDCHSCRRILCCDIFLRFLAIIPLSLSVFTNKIATHAVTSSAHGLKWLNNDRLESFAANHNYFN